MRKKRNERRSQSGGFDLPGELRQEVYNLLSPSDRVRLQRLSSGHRSELVPIDERRRLGEVRQGNPVVNPNLGYNPSFHFRGDPQSTPREVVEYINQNFPAITLHIRTMQNPSYILARSVGNFLEANMHQDPNRHGHWGQLRNMTQYLLAFAESARVPVAKLAERLYRYIYQKFIEDEDGPLDGPLQNGLHDADWDNVQGKGMWAPLHEHISHLYHISSLLQQLSLLLPPR